MVLCWLELNTVAVGREEKRPSLQACCSHGWYPSLWPEDSGQWLLLEGTFSRRGTDGISGCQTPMTVPPSQVVSSSVHWMRVYGR